MKTIRIIFVVILSFAQAEGFSQEALSNKQELPFGISVNLLGPTALGISLNKYFSPEIEGSINIGSAPLLTIILSSGVDYHFNAAKLGKWSPYVGAHISMWNPNKVDRFLSCWTFSKDESNKEKHFHYACNTDEDLAIGLYNPLGIQYYSDKGFTFALEFAIYSRFGQFSQVRTWGGLKLGHRLK